jgi:cytoskeletal protein CcmA (bactofilin family)
MTGSANTAPGPDNGRTSGEVAQADGKPESLVDRHSTFNGNYRSSHNLRIEGVVDGQIECKGTLTIAEEARVKAKVMAQNVTVAGNLEGEVTCPGRFQILPPGHVVGKVVAGVLDIRAGAFYEGDLSMYRQDDRGGKRTESKFGAAVGSFTHDLHSGNTGVTVGAQEQDPAFKASNGKPKEGESGILP